MRPFRMLVAVVVAAVLAPAIGAGEVKTDLPGIGTERILVGKGEPTNAGTFEGTWLYVNRDARFAMWTRVKDGVPQVKLQYQSLADPEAFETDWDGKALYYLAGSPVTFELKLGASTPDRIVGTWSWVAEVGGTGRRESADIVIFRTGYGRTLVMDFPNYQLTITKGGKNMITKPPVVWSWVKISKRELLWDEMPF